MSTPDESPHPVEPTVGTNVTADQRYTSAAATAADIDPNNPPWGMLAGFLTWAGSVVLLFATQFFVLVAYVLYRRLKFGETGELLAQNKTAILLVVLSYIPAHLLTLGVVWAVVTRFGKRPFWRSLGWNWSKNFGFWASFGLAIGLYLIGFLLIYFIGAVSTSFDQTISSSRAIAISIAFLAVATAPIVEETVYRGVLYSALHKKLGVNWAVVGVLALFTLVHVPQYWPDFGRIGLLGLLSLSLTLVRAYTGRLLPCFIIHTVFNGIQSVLILIEPYLPKSLTGEEPKAPGMILSHLIHILSFKHGL